MHFASMNYNTLYTFYPYRLLLSYACMQSQCLKVSLTPADIEQRQYTPALLPPHPLVKLVLPIDPDIFQLSEILEMYWSMYAVVEANRGIKSDMHRLLLDCAKCAAHEAVVPDTRVGNEEVASNLVREEELALLAE